MTIPSQDGFEDYRRDRKRRRAREKATRRPTSVGSMDVVKELERQEAAELQDQQLTREVQEFFVDATQTAASIMQKVSKQQEVDQKERMKDEMEEFLMSTLQRLERFVTAIRSNADDRQATTEIETTMQNIVGPVLDAFRHEGTAQLEDKHIGQDPFATELAHAEKLGPAENPDAMPGADFEVESEPEAAVDSPLEGFAPVAGPPPEEVAAAEDPKAIRRLEEGDAGEDELPGHLIAELHEEAEASRRPAPVYETARAPEPPPAPAAESGPRAADHPMLASLVGDPEKLKKALKVLVQNHLMTRDEALAIWRAERG